MVALVRYPEELLAILARYREGGNKVRTAAPVVLSGDNVTPEIWRIHREGGGGQGGPLLKQAIVEELDRFFGF